MQLNQGERLRQSLDGGLTRNDKDSAPTGFGRVSSVPDGPSHAQSRRTENVSFGFSRASSAPAIETSICAKEDQVANKLAGLGIRLEKESDRAKCCIKQALEQRRLNDATGILVQGLFSSVSPANLSGRISEIFRDLDTDNSGGLDCDEIGRAFVIVEKPLKDTDILAWLNEFDADGNGVIDEDEFAHMVRNRMGIPCAISCIPCLRGCSTTQRRSLPKKISPLLTRVHKPATINEGKIQAEDEGVFTRDQLLPSIAYRKKEMMKGMLTRNPAAHESAGGRSDAGRGSSDAGRGSSDAGSGGNGDTFRRTASAPGAFEINMMSEKEQIDQIFKMVKRNSIAQRVDSQWQKRATDTALSAASKVTEQLNYFLVAHLKSVPLDKLSNRISQTFATIDLDGSGEINTYELGLAFERLGNPLSADELEAHMKSVDIDGNGVCDAHEFEHLTRKLLNIDCTPQCAPCKFLHGKGLGDNWGKNRDAALAALAPPKKQEDSDLFTRVLSSPVARQEINRAKARGGTPTDPLKPAGEKNAAIHPKANKATSVGKRSTSNGTSLPLRAYKANSPLGTKPSRFIKRLHDGITKNSIEQRVN